MALCVKEAPCQQATLTFWCLNMCQKVPIWYGNLACPTALKKSCGVQCSKSSMGLRMQEEYLDEQLHAAIEWFEWKNHRSSISLCSTSTQYKMNMILTLAMLSHPRLHLNVTSCCGLSWSDSFQKSTDMKDMIVVCEIPLAHAGAKSLDLEVPTRRSNPGVCYQQAPQSTHTVPKHTKPGII